MNRLQKPKNKTDRSQANDQPLLRISRNSRIDASIQTPASLSHRYRFIRQIGYGSQGKVFLAEQTETGRIVAIKQLNIESVKNWKEYELFQREANVLAGLNIDGVARV
jgi:serine/threonine protein kinase